MRREFRIDEHEEYGMAGLTPLWMPSEQSDPLTGIGVAHDVLEHGSNDRVEWQGLGGCVLVRGSNYFGRSGIGNPTPHESIGIDFVNLFHLWEGQSIPDPGRTQRVDDWADEMIQEAVNYGCKLVRSEVRYQNDAESLNKARHWTNEVQRRRMVGWMRRGYRAAVRRYRDYQQFKLTETFVAIENAVDKFLKSEGDRLGLKVTLTYSIQHETASLRLHDEEY